MTPRWQTARGLIRRFRPDRNPLRRTTDRVEAAILAGLAVILLVAAPLAGGAAVSMAAADGARAGHAQASWRQTEAVLLRTAPKRAFVLSEASPEPVVPARWTAPDGTRHVGNVQAPGGTKAGDAVPVWTNRSGDLEAPPAQRANVVVWEAIAGFAAVTAVIVLVVGAAILARFLLDRRRFAGWDAAWPVIESRWTGRR